MAAMAAASASPASAQCAPDPTVANGTTNCTGTDGDGLSVTTSGTNVVVAAGALVQSGSAAAAITTTSGLSSVTVNGRVDGGSKPGLIVTTGAPSIGYCDPYAGASPNYSCNSGPVLIYPSAYSTITVGADGLVTGSQALVIQRVAGSTTNNINFSLTNSGTLTGIAGTAVLLETGTALATISNLAGGRIGGISGTLGLISNAGIVDGGSNVAILATGSFLTVNNNGTIVSAAGTTSVSSAGALSVNNAAGATIGGGAVALRAAGTITLNNYGTINGSVVSTLSSAPSLSSGSMIDTLQGTINGDLILGSSNDTLRARYDIATGRIASITGVIDGGAGSDTLIIGVDSNVAMGGAILPTNFEILGLELSKNAAVTLLPTFPNIGVSISGSGSLVNQATLVTTGPAITSGYWPNLALTNQASITATLAQATQYAVTGPGTFTNNGTIVAIGGRGVQANGALINAGTITATDNAVEVSSGRLTNTGTISSGAGIGAWLMGSAGYSSTNSGTIEGDTVGVRLGTSLTNTGTVRATNGNGTALLLDTSGAIINSAGGVIGTGGQAITGAGPYATVVNAGTINGNVSLTYSSPGGMTQRYISQSGGVLNGNLVLGSGGLLFTDLANTGPGQFAGITGTVTAASGALLRYRVTGEQSAVIGPVGPFAGATYQLTSGSTLTLTAPGTITSPLTLAGTGAVDLTANLSATTGPAILTTTAISESLGYDTAGALSITSRGTITLALAAGSTNLLGRGISLTNADTFVNLGTISVTNRTSNYLTGIGIGVGTGSGTVTNAGSILLDGGTGITGGRIVNTGTITQIAGGATASGVASPLSLDNSGTISVGGIAVTPDNSSEIINSGTIASTGGIAITGAGTGTSARITNASGGSISGTGGTAVRLYYGTFANAGTVNGTVDMGYGFPYYSGAPTRSYASSTYVAAGGTIVGDLLFGDGADLLLQTSDSIGVSGTINGGGGTNIYGRSAAASATIAIDPAGMINFQDGLVQAVGADTVVTATATGTFGGNLYLTGTGSVINQAAIKGALTTSLPSFLSNVYSANPFFPMDQIVSSVTNTASVEGGAYLSTPTFINTGTILSAGSTSFSTGQPAVTQFAGTALSFKNSGTITAVAPASPYITAGPAVQIYGDTSVNFSNSGTIGSAEGTASYLSTVSISAGSNAVIGNSGRISGNGLAAVAGSFENESSPSLNVTNSGTISSSGRAAALDLSGAYGAIGTTANAANSGTISAQASASVGQGLAIGVSLHGSAPFGTVPNNVSGTITNSAGGTISASGTYAYAVLANNAALTLINDGTISASGTNLAFAVASNSADLGSTIRNTGTISGAIRLGGGDDLIENRGLIDGDVFLGAGNDSFLQLAGSVTGTVDGGIGLDILTIDTAQSGTIDANRFVNFERFTQAGSGNATYTGAFTAQSFGISGGSLTVAEGASLTSTDAVTIAGSSSGEQVTNAGTISGSVNLGGGNDTVVNRGSIGGAVMLEDGDDSFTETATGSVAGPVDGGVGTDTYVVELAGDRTGIGARRNFENLGVTGSGMLTLTLDQSWQQLMLTGTNLNLNLGGFSVASLTGGAAAEQVVTDGDLANVALGGGDDRLTLGTAILAGTYDGGAGANTLRTTASGPITLSGTVSNFGVIDLGSGPLSISGSLTGAAGGTVLAGSGHIVSIERGATVAGPWSLGVGANSLRIMAGSTVGGAITGGDGSGATALQILNDGGTLALAASLSGFDIATLTGGGTVQVNGAWTVGSVSFDGNLAVGSAGSIAAANLTGSAGNNILTLGGRVSGNIDLGAGNDTLRLTGAFASGGSVTGGAGTDTLELAVSGTGDAPTNVGATPFSSFETLKAISGVAILGGTQSFANGVDVGAGARLIGAAGSVFTAPVFTVAAGGTFGTAGTVNGNVAVSGTLSPGASPGTMTVNGNVALATGSNALFELTSTVSDQLLVSGNVTIASGATLTLTGNRPLTPGVTLDLIISNGGITGSFATVSQAASVGGFLSQSANRISLLGTFLTSSAFSPQVNRAIDGVNSLLISGKANAAVLAGVPKLIVGGAADAAAFARISPEPFAAATALATEDGLSLIDATRNQTRSATTSTGLFSFAQGMGTRYRVSGDAKQGINSARLSSSGGFAGVGFGAEVASVGLFVGYGQSRQSIGALGSSLHGDGLIAGVQASAGFAGFKVAALAAYSERDVRLSRAAPQGGTQSNFHLRDTLADVTASYSLPLAPALSLKPRVGLSYIHVERGKTAETGSSPFTLQLASASTTNWFVDAGFDIAGAIGPVRPFLGVAVRQRLSGRQNNVEASFTGTSTQIAAFGATSGRSSVLGSAGASVDLTPKLSLSAGYTGAFSHTTRHSGTIGLRYLM